MSSEYDDDIEEWLDDGEELADWDIEGTKTYFEGLERSAKRIIDTNFLEKVENSVGNLEAKYGKKGYPYYPYKYPSNYKELPISSRLELVEKRLNALMEWATKHGVELSKCPYEDKYKERKAELEKTIAEMLQDRFPIQWDRLSSDGRRKWVGAVLRVSSLKSKEQLGTLENAVLSVGFDIIKTYDDGFSRRKCPLCGWTDSIMSYSDYYQHMSRVHTEFMDKFLWAIQSLEPTRYHRPSPDSTKVKETMSKDIPKSLSHQGSLLKSRKELLKDQNA